MDKTSKKWLDLPDLIVVMVRSFHLFFSFGGCCRFEPTCSQYSSYAIRTQGFFWGGWLSLKRVLKCHPVGRHGFDFVERKVG